jgi:hypothetical protein
MGHFAFPHTTEIESRCQLYSRFVLFPRTSFGSVYQIANAVYLLSCFLSYFRSICSGSVPVQLNGAKRPAKERRHRSAEESRTCRWRRLTPRLRVSSSSWLEAPIVKDGFEMTGIVQHPRRHPYPRSRYHRPAAADTLAASHVPYFQGMIVDSARCGSYARRARKRLRQPHWCDRVAQGLQASPVPPRNQPAGSDMQENRCPHCVKLGHACCAV